MGIVGSALFKKMDLPIGKLDRWMKKRNGKIGFDGLNSDRLRT